jgi:hypothetical protein
MPTNIAHTNSQVIRQVLNDLPALPQRQDSTIDQLRDLRAIANRLGMYDAADYLRIALQRQEQAEAEQKRAINKLRQDQMIACIAHGFLTHENANYTERRK